MRGQDEFHTSKGVELNRRPRVGADSDERFLCKDKASKNRTSASPPLMAAPAALALQRQQDAGQEAEHVA